MITLEYHFPESCRLSTINLLTLELSLLLLNSAQFSTLKSSVFIINCLGNGEPSVNFTGLTTPSSDNTVVDIVSKSIRF